MTRSRLVIPSSLVLLAIMVTAIPLLAHEGHGDGEIAPFDLDTPRKVSPETAAHIGLRTAEVGFGRIEDVVRLSGVVRPAPEKVHSISSRVEGTVLAVAAQVGDMVREGDLLVELESPQLTQSIYELRKLETEAYALQTQIAGARSRISEFEVELEVAKEHATIAQEEFDRVRDSDGAVAVSVLSEKRAEAVRSRGKSQLTEIELSLAREQVESMDRQAASMDRSHEALEQVITTMANTHGASGECDIAAIGNASLGSSASGAHRGESLGTVRFYSPISGVVVRREVVSGQGVGVGQTLLTVAEYSTVQIAGELPESLVSGAGDLEGKEVRVRRVSDPRSNAIATGTVRFVSPVIDPIKRTTHVIVEAENPDGNLRDGLYVDLVVVLREEEDAVVVPASAVVSDGPMHFVFVYDGEFYTKQDIDLGTRDDQFVEVKAGLVPGDAVVIRGAYSLTQLRPKAGVNTDG